MHAYFSNYLQKLSQMKNIKLQGYFTCKLCSAAVQYKRGIPNRKKRPGNYFQCNNWPGLTRNE